MRLMARKRKDTFDPVEPEKKTPKKPKPKKNKRAQKKKTKASEMVLAETDSQGAIVPYQDIQLLRDFYTPERISDALRAAGWTPHEKIKTLVELARSGTKKVAIDAIDRLDQLVQEQAGLSGEIATSTETATITSPDGKSQISRTTTYLQKGQGADYTERMLAAAQSGQEAPALEQEAEYEITVTDETPTQEEQDGRSEVSGLQREAGESRTEARGDSGDSDAEESGSGVGTESEEGESDASDGSSELGGSSSQLGRDRKTGSIRHGVKRPTRKPVGKSHLSRV